MIRYACTLSSKGVADIKWWRDNIHSAVKSLNPHPEIDYIIYTDASNDGWGADDSSVTINGRWNEVERELHINVQEMLAIKLALLSFLKYNDSITHVRIMSDNATSIAYINKQGGSKSMDCNDLSVEIWEICILHDVHISAAHIPGKHNIIADTASRKFNDVAEWMLDPPMFQKLCSLFSVPDIDMFETRLNKQLDQYVSWLPDPGSVSIDAMATCWSNHYIYIFPPFSMFWPVVKKIQLEAQKALVIAPLWPTQTWFPKLLQMSVDTPLLISSCNLRLPGTSLKHPLYPKLRLMAVLCSNSSQL